MIFDDLMNRLAYDYKHPSIRPDGSKDADRNGHTRMAVLQEKYQLSSLKIQKLLVTAGVYEPVKTTASYHRVKELLDAGKSESEIMKETGLSRAVVNACIPYKRGPKNADQLGIEISSDAVRKRRQRSNQEMKKENARNRLAIDFTDESFWYALGEHDQITFVTEDGQRFVTNTGYAVEGNNSVDMLLVTLVDSNGRMGEKIRLPKNEVLDAFHRALEWKADKKRVAVEDLGGHGRYILPILVFFGALEGDKKKVTTKREIKESGVCSCCGGIGTPLYPVSCFEDLIILNEQINEERREAWTEEEKKSAARIEKMLAAEKENYHRKVEAAKTSKVVQNFNSEGDRLFCQLCALTIYHALTEGDVPYVGKKRDYREIPLDMAQRLYSNQLISTNNRWTDHYGHEGEEIYEAVDSKGTKHYFDLTYRRMGPLLGFDAQEVHRLTKAGKRAVNNTDTDYEFHHLISLTYGDDEEQRRYAGFLELMDEVSAGLQSPTIEKGYLRTTGTIIPVSTGDEYSFRIDGRVYSGEELARMASSAEGWQIQFQIKDPSEAVLRANEYLMPVRLGEKELVDETVELLRLFAKNGEFLSEHDEENFTYLFEKDVLKKLKLYNDSNPRGFGKLAGMGIIKVLELYEGTEWCQYKVREVISGCAG